MSIDSLWLLPEDSLAVMKTLIATLALTVLAFAPAAIAEEVTYIAGMTGVT